MKPAIVEEFNEFEILWDNEGHCIRYTVCIGANLYLTGYTKWDGCTEITYHETHYCGGPAISEHILLLQHLYNESFVRMAAEGYVDDDPLTIKIEKNHERST